MSVELEWRFADEIPERTPEEERRPRRPRWQVWLAVVVVIMLLIGAGVYAWWRVRRDALATVEAEVQAVARLEMQALATGDMELYLSLQDDGDPDWYAAQQARATLDASFPPPLPSLTVSTALTVENARVVGDVGRVELVRAAGLPGEEMHPFRAVRFYRRAEDGRWLHTAADRDYAGGNIVFAGRQLGVTAFATDAERLRPVASRLEGLADQFCDLAMCQTRLPLPLVFTDTLDTVPGPEGVLVAPFVASVPDDELAQVTWETSLHEILFDQLIAHEAGYPLDLPQAAPHGGQLFYARLREWLRASLGLREPIFLDTQLIGQALDAGTWIHVQSLWDGWAAEDGPQRPLAEAEVDLLLAFVEDQYDSTRVARLLPALSEAYWTGALIEEALGEPWTDFEQRYVAYVHQVTGRPTEPPGQVAPFTEYDLVAACGSPASLWGLRLDQPEMTPLSPATGLGSLDWSPDGRWLLAWRGGVLGNLFYLVEADGSGVRHLTSIPPEARPAGWSPDGNHVAYSAVSLPPGGGLVDVETGESVSLDGYFFTWSPDGSQLAYVTVTRTATIWLGEGDGSNPRPVGGGLTIAWSPDGTQLAFMGTYPEPGLKVHDVRTGETAIVVESSTLHDLLNAESERVAAQVDSLAWSPTGEWIGFGVNQHDETGPVKGTVALVGPDGEHPRMLFTHQVGVTVAGWSPDGRWLTSIIHGPGPYAIYVTDTDGMPLLETDVMTSWTPTAAVAWSPDGQYLAVAGVEGVRILEVEDGTWYAFEPQVNCALVAWNPLGPQHESSSNGE